MHSSCSLIKGRISPGAGVLPVFTKKPLLCTSRLPSLTRASASMSWLWTFGEVPELPAPELQEVSKRLVAMSPEERSQPNAVRIIDVRTAGEYQAGHIQGALNASFLPPWDWPSRVTPLVEGLDKGCELYVICLSAHRSIGALKWLREKGYTNVKQLQGGMKAWREQGLPEVKS